MQEYIFVLAAVYLISNEAAATFGMEQYEPTGEERLCLRRDEVTGFVMPIDDLFVFATTGGLYFSETQSPCPYAKPDSTAFQVITQGSMICRNDKMYIGRDRLKYSREFCTFDKFIGMKPKLEAAN